MRKGSILKFMIISLSLSFVFVACQKDQPKNTGTSTTTTPVKQAPATMGAAKVQTPVPPKIDPETLAAVIEMKKGGKIVIEFYPKDAPNTVDNFIKLAKKGFYNNLTFHRVIPGFMAQGGDPQGDGMGGPGYTIKDEFNTRKHIAGTVAMARPPEPPDSAGSQFYICFEPQPHLDGQYTVFGQVIDGMDVVNKIQKGDVMKSITIVDKASLKKTSQ
ncbi:MAG: peptidyl-prolyl cis-trans isomerase [Candidatus Poribacteria bacterium]|nr:peptidyl-prolyl cis-trans isomerase [Candidatus Poribacteria bacterium]